MYWQHVISKTTVSMWILTIYVMQYYQFVFGGLRGSSIGLSGEHGHLSFKQRKYPNMELR